LRVCVGDDKIHALQASGDHVVDSIAASATHTNDGDTWL
jgi:hypothetical protein